MSSVLNTGNWYMPLTPVMAFVLLVLSILIEWPICWVLLTSREEKENEQWLKKDLAIPLVVAFANFMSFCVGYFLMSLWGVTQ